MFNTEGFAGRERTYKEQHRRPIKTELPAKNKTKADTKPLEAEPELSEEEIERTLEESPLFKELSPMCFAFIAFSCSSILVGMGIIRGELKLLRIGCAGFKRVSVKIFFIKGKSVDAIWSRRCCFSP